MRNLLKSVFLVFCCAQAAFATPRSTELTNLTIITDPALILPLSELVRQYSVSHHVAVTLVSSEEKDPATLIGEGMEAHILISADDTLTAGLQLRGLIDVFAQNPLVRTDLALVRRKEDLGSTSLTGGGQWNLSSAFSDAIPILTLDPAQYVEGARSIAVLNANDVPVSNRVTVETKRVMRSRLKNGESYGILLATDVFLDPDLGVVSILPASQYEPVTFMALVLASESMPEARELAKFLSSSAAMERYAQYGFKPIEKAD
jgi:ABC-type molybdate transport system substrate-binding protein